MKVGGDAEVLDRVRPVLVGYSGGLDSTSLAYIASDLPSKRRLRQPADQPGTVEAGIDRAECLKQIDCA